MRATKTLLLYSFLLLSIFSCRKETPSGFWLNYQEELIISEESDQGPWGGKRAIKWKSQEANTFTEQQLLNVAKENGWELIEKISPADSTIRTNKSYSFDILREDVISEWPQASVIYIFKTGWLAVEPGNTDETFNNGFASINPDGTELTVYHRWGE